MIERTPLNGTKTHALTDYARECLQTLLSGPRPAQVFNPGVVDRLTRGDLVTLRSLPSPYKTHKGRPIAFLEITDAGRATVFDGGK